MLAPGGLVADRDTAEHGGASHFQVLWRDPRLGLRRVGLVLKSAEYAHAGDRYRPFIGNGNLNATEHRGGVDHGLLLRDSGAPQVQFDASERGRQLAALKI